MRIKNQSPDSPFFTSLNRITNLFQYLINVHNFLNQARESLVDLIMTPVYGQGERLDYWHWRGGRCAGEERISGLWRAGPVVLLVSQPHPVSLGLGSLFLQVPVQFLFPQIVQGGGGAGARGTERVARRAAKVWGPRWFGGRQHGAPAVGAHAAVTGNEGVDGRDELSEVGSIAGLVAPALIHELVERGWHLLGQVQAVSCLDHADHFRVLDT